MKRRSSITLVIAAVIIVSIIAVLSAWKFRDVKDDDWYAEGVSYVLDNKYMNGMDDSTFAPNEPVTRGMLITVLYRIEGSPIVTGSGTFADVKADSYCADAVIWGAQNGIVNGYSAKSFGPNDCVTREQLATILYRYSDFKKYDTSKASDLSSFSDYGGISGYAVNSMSWAVAEGLIAGTSEKTLSPEGTATRAQLATIIMRFDANVVPAEADETPLAIEEAAEDDDQSEETPQPENTEAAEVSTEPESSIEDDKTTEAEFSEVTEAVSAGTTTLSETSPVITLENVAVESDSDSVKLAVTVKNNPGILGMSLTINYDESKMTLKSAANGAAFKNVLTLTKSKTLSSGCKFVWDGVEVAAEDIADGEILVLTFQINDNTPGSYPVSLSYEPGSIVDNNLNSLNIAIVNGSITITK